MESSQDRGVRFFGSRRFWFWLGGLLFLTGLWAGAGFHTTGLQYNHRGSSRMDKLSLEFSGGCVSFQWSPYPKSTSRPGTLAMWQQEGTGFELWPDFRQDSIIPVGSHLLRVPLWPLPVFWVTCGAWWLARRQRPRPPSPPPVQTG